MMDRLIAQIGVDPTGIAIAGLVIFLFFVVALVVLLIGSGVLAGVGVYLLSLFMDRRAASKPREAGVPKTELLIKPYKSLTRAQREAVFAVRHEVFVVGQGITSVPDQDGEDEQCEHVLAYIGHQVVGTARLKPIENAGVKQIKVGRLAVLGSARGQGVGRRIMRAVNALLDERGVGGVMHAQAYLTDWYTTLGWRAVGDAFMEAGIVHRKMVYYPAGGVGD